MNKLLSIALLLATLLTFSACEEEPQDSLVGTTWSRANTGENVSWNPYDPEGETLYYPNRLENTTTFIEFAENNTACAFLSKNGSTGTPEPFFSKYKRNGEKITFDPPLSVRLDNHDIMIDKDYWGISHCEVMGNNLKVYYNHVIKIGAETVFLGEEYVYFRKR